MKAWLVLILSIAFAVSPFLNPEFGGFDPERYPVPQYDHPVQPAGWAFGIWGLIYLALIGHAGFGLLYHRDSISWDRGRATLILSLAVGSIWLPVALLSPVWATILIWVMLIGSIVSLMKVSDAQPVWQVGWPVALYAGWLSAATFVSVGLLLSGYDILGQTSSAVLCLCLATLFAVYLQLKVRCWTYGAAVVWGLMGISAANHSSEKLVALLAVAAAGLVTGAILFARRRSQAS